MKKTAEHTNKSFKTLYLYALLVVIVICISLLVKGFYIIQKSKVDPAHLFVLAVTKQNNVQELIAFHPETPSVALFVVQNNIPYASLANHYGIATDGYIQTGETTIPGTDVIAFMWSTIMHTGAWQTDLTLYDKVRLLLLARNVSTNNKLVKNLTLNENAELDTTTVNALTDQDIATENNTVQIVNATGITGFGQRLARVLTNLGANVIDISTARTTQEKSTIEYFGNQSYTLTRLQELLHITATRISKRPIATIVITIGNDNTQGKSF